MFCQYKFSKTELFGLRFRLLQQYELSPQQLHLAKTSKMDTQQFWFYETISTKRFIEARKLFIFVIGGSKYRC